MDATVTLKLQQLKDYWFARKVLIIVEEEEDLARDILKLLEELTLPEFPAPIARYLIQFKAFFTQLVKDLVLCRNIDFQIKMKIKEMRLEWDFSEDCEKKLSDFEAKKQERLSKQQVFDQQISYYQAQLAKLTKKIDEVEAQKSSLDTTEPLLTQDVVNWEVLKGISHDEKALEIKVRINQLWEKKSLLNNIIGHEKTLFEDFKSRFPA